MNELFRKAKSIPHQRILTYLFFVVLSTVFWFLRALNDSYRADIMYPVKYVNIPENRVVTRIILVVGSRSGRWDFDVKNPAELHDSV